MSLAINFDDVIQAAETITGIVNRTPILTSRTINHLTGYEVYFKCENFQRVGAFKFRGAYNALSRLSEAEKAGGVITHSSGNHAQGIALSAKLLGISATIVMPTDAPQSKMNATRDYGAEIVLYDRQVKVREEVSAQVGAERGLTLIHPYDHPHIMAGQGTVALELLADVPDLDILVGPVGGGGLLSGCSTAAKTIKPNIEIFGVETETSNDWWLSFQQNERVHIPPPDTIADGIRTQQPGELTYPVIRELVSEILLVSDKEVISAMRLLLTRLKILAEPTGAVALAAVLNRLKVTPGSKVGVIISGGNVDEELLANLLQST
ncbi:threo-3-hydroxy-L-aspartate ammonia-lyase [Anaerolineales bacterium HSG6]|nr:threo-3-hydroxy-L-aspartate ammonia-lyase [Anaerolineales bacterium HSG6]MDM8532993.1 threo-3-hydroxy-L-aspartate ammonia-lyase [Anaerolineales bacterium HSG25]